MASASVVVVAITFDFACSEEPPPCAANVAARAHGAAAHGAVLGMRPYMLVTSSLSVGVALAATSARLPKAAVFGKASETAHVVRVPRKTEVGNSVTEKRMASVGSYVEIHR